METEPAVDARSEQEKELEAVVCSFLFLYLFVFGLLSKISEKRRIPNDKIWLLN
jgi:hypothetical protein